MLVGRGVLRNPWILAQAADLAAGRDARVVTMRDRGQFLLDYIELLMNERVGEAEGFRHTAPVTPEAGTAQAEGLGLRAPARGRERWVVNKLRALNAWYSKGYEGGSNFRTAINHAESVTHVRELVGEFFFRYELDARLGTCVSRQVPKATDEGRASSADDFRLPTPDSRLEPDPHASSSVMVKS